MFCFKNSYILDYSKNSDRLMLFSSKIGLIISIISSYIIIIYSDGFFSDSLEKAFCFIAETVIIPNIITLLEVKIKN